MSSRSAPVDVTAAPAEPDNRRDAARSLVLPVQLVLGVLYPFLAHAASTRGGAWAALASRAPLRVSYDMRKRDNPVWRWVFPHRVPEMHRGHMVERNLAFLRELGLPLVEGDQRCQMAFSAADQALARQKLAAAGVAGDYILLHPTSRWFFKCWEDERYAAVMTALAEEGHRIVLTSAPVAGEMAMVERLLALAQLIL